MRLQFWGPIFQTKLSPSPSHKREKAVSLGENTQEPIFQTKLFPKNVISTSLTDLGAPSQSYPSSDGALKTVEMLESKFLGIV